MTNTRQICMCFVKNESFVKSVEAQSPGRRFIAIESGSKYAVFAFRSTSTCIVAMGCSTFGVCVLNA